MAKPNTTAITPTTPHGTRRRTEADGSIITVAGRTALLAPVTRLDSFFSGWGCVGLVTGLVMAAEAGAEVGVEIGFETGLVAGGMVVTGFVGGLNCGSEMGVVGGKSGRGGSSSASTFWFGRGCAASGSALGGSGWRTGLRVTTTGSCSRIFSDGGDGGVEATLNSCPQMGQDVTSAPTREPHAGQRLMMDFEGS
jgi:hypothetical protein